MTAPTVGPVADPAFGPAVEPVVVAEPVVLSARDARGTLEFVRLLREAAGAAAPVTWDGTVELDPSWPVHHLPPPAGGEGLAAWRAAYRHGLCHYRRGPGFVLVTDRRRGARPETLVLDAGDELATFERFAEIGPAATGRPAFDRLVAAGLVLVLDGLALALPYRLRRWPIPCTEV